MSRPWDVVTTAGAPRAVIDLDQFDANAQRLLSRAGGTPVRVASKSIRVRSLLDRVLGLPGFRGVLGYSAAEALWLAHNGIDDIVVAYPTVDERSVRQIAADPHLAESICFMVDLPEHVAWLAVLAQDTPLRVALDIDCSYRRGPISLGAHRSSIWSTEQAGRMAGIIAGTAGVRLSGMMFYEAHVAGVPDQQPGSRLLKRLSNEQLATRRGEIRAAVEQHGPVEFVNGGGTGSLHTTRLDPAITELAAGSGLFTPTSFDGFDELGTSPAAYFVSPVTRKPSDDAVVAMNGGYLASGVANRSRMPVPVHPEGLKYFGQEGAGEVQTPLRGKAARKLKLGDLIWFRHAKAGEMCERFNAVTLVSGGEVVDEVRTYRGEGVNFG